LARRQLIEIIDQDWCPQVVREGVTGYLRLIESIGNSYRVAVPHLCRALEATGDEIIVDLGAGAGGPWRRLRPLLERELGRPLRVVLTDLHPGRLPSSGAASSVTLGVERWHEPVDARAVGGELLGFRVLCSTFHHFTPDDARRVLRDAVQRRQGIALLEMTQRSPLALLLMLTTPLTALLLTPLIRPFSWARLLLTYLIPVIPLVTAFDGVVSCLRTYTTEELEALVESIEAPEYSWEIEKITPPLALIPVTVLTGVPRGAAAADSREARSTSPA
jgi:hypothetical protein